MTSTKKIFEKINSELIHQYDERECKNLTYMLMQELLNIDRTGIIVNRNFKMDISKEEKLANAISRLQQHEPVQYILGRTYFLNRSFFVEPGVLIPRPETEELVNLIIRNNHIEAPVILDICSGSGSIAISLDLEIAGSKTRGIEKYTQALDVSRKNNDALQSSVLFEKSDILKMEILEYNYDIIVSNPPYIPVKEAISMNLNVTRYEPSQALFVENHAPLIFYERIIHLAKEGLNKQGKLFFEVHENYAHEVLQIGNEILTVNGKVFKDMQGKDRMIMFSKA